jgi:hypothetical protein
VKGNLKQNLSGIATITTSLTTLENTMKDIVAEAVARMF